MRPGKHQRSKQRCWKVHGPAQSFVLHSYAMYELRNQQVSERYSSSVRSKQLYCVLCRVKGKNRTITHNKNL